jgi:hypothetical protein
MRHFPIRSFCDFYSAGHRLRALPKGLFMLSGPSDQVTEAMVRIFSIKLDTESLFAMLRAPAQSDTVLLVASRFPSQDFSKDCEYI